MSDESEFPQIFNDVSSRQVLDAVTAGNIMDELMKTEKGRVELARSMVRYLEYMITDLLEELVEAYEKSQKEK